MSDSPFDLDQPAFPLPLRALSLLYRAGWKSYLSMYELGLKKRSKPPCPILGVGNLTVGGTGKTPFVIALLEALRESKKIAVSCSGYGGALWRETTLLEPNETLPPDQIGEEPLLIRNAFPSIPIVIGKKRLLATQAACERWSPDLIVLDDGFQHLPLARTIDLLLFDARAPLGNGYCLPAGRLREPLSGTRRADALVFIHESEQAKQQNREPLPRLPAPKPLFHAWRSLTVLEDAKTGERIEWDALRESGIIPLSALGNPSIFERALVERGVDLKETMRFPDHHFYTHEDLKRLSQAAKRHSAPVVTTQKDWIKLRPLSESIDFTLLIANMRIQLEEAFIEWLQQTLNSRRVSPSITES